MYFIYNVTTDLRSRTDINVPVLREKQEQVWLDVEIN